MLPWRESPQVLLHFHKLIRHSANFFAGSVSQWGEVKKKHPKTKESTPLANETNTRGRGRGSIEGRGRGRGAERATRAGRGARTVSQANGTKQADKPIKTTEEVWDVAATQPAESKPTNGEATIDWINEVGKDQSASIAPEEPKPAAASAQSSTKAGGWASLFAKPPPAPVVKKAPTPSAAPVPAATSTAAAESVPTSAPEEPISVPAPAPEPVIDEPPIEIASSPIETPQNETDPSELPSALDTEAAIVLTPSKDELTEKNLDKLPDISHPVATATAASTTASTQDPMNPAVPVASAVRPGMSGYAASALKATSGTGRSASYSRKVLEQQEAVVMPGNHAVDRAAVQFGKMGMNGDDDEADEEREEPETRTQLPDDSPAAPRASLPPAIPEAKAPAETVSNEAPMPRPAPGLPPAPQAQQSSPPQSSNYSDQYRYSQGQKAYDPFTQQSQPQGPATTETFSNQVPAQSQGHPGNLQDYSQYYNTSREYQQYYGGYGHGQDTQRSGSSYGTSAQDAQAQYATSRPQQAYGQQDASNSGHNTPNPSASSHQAQQSQHVQGQTAQGGQGGYPYGYPSGYGQQYPQYGGASYMGGGGMSQRYGQNRPMFDDVRRGDSDYYGGNQYGYGHNQQQYGASYKSNMYGQPQQHQYSHDYSSSPAANAGFGGREATYGRTGSAQPSEAQQSAAGSNAFGGMPDPFGRTASGFGQTQGHGSHQSGEEQVKQSGPSPSLQGNRPGSALNNMGSQQQGGLPHQQSQHSAQGFSGYPQYGGFGGNQSHQGSYGGGYGTNAAFGGYGRGYGAGWSGNYGSGHN